MDEPRRMRPTDEDERTRERAQRMRIPDEYPGNYDADDVCAWMLAAEPGSAEQLLLTMLEMAHEEGAAAVAPLAPAIGPRSARGSIRRGIGAAKTSSTACRSRSRRA